MQRPLNPNRLRALVEHGLDNDHELDVLSAKQYPEKQNLSEGLFNLHAAFEIFPTRLRILSRHWEDKKRGLDNWLIYFSNHPFNHLNVRLDPERQAFVKVHEDEREIQAFEILGNPEQSQAMLQWFWEYGNERLIRQAAIIDARKVFQKEFEPGYLPQKSLLDFALHGPFRPKHFKA